MSLRWTPLWYSNDSGETENSQHDCVPYSFTVYYIATCFGFLTKKNPHSGTVKYLKNDYHIQHDKMFHFLTNKKKRRNVMQYNIE